MLGGEGEDGLGDDVSLAAAEGDEAAVDGGGGLHGELLVEDAAGERVEGRVVVLEGGWLVGVDDAGEIGVDRAEVAEGDGDLAV